MADDDLSAHMSSIPSELVYSTLLSVVPTSIAIIVPLIGAFWIFKVRERAVTEGKIFEVGREIANYLQVANIRGPYDLLFEHLIDKAGARLNEPNHENVLRLLLRENLFWRCGGDPSDVERRESAEILVAVAAARVQGLIPPTVTWSGRGSVYSPFGERVGLRDSFFPFGTRLYREWIESFSQISMDLWAISSARKHFLDALPLKAESREVWRSRELVDSWMGQVDALMGQIRPLHAKLLTLIQVIDSQIDLPRFGRDIAVLSWHLLLLAISGYFLPKAIHLSGMSSIKGISALAVAAVLSYCLIFIRLKMAASPPEDGVMLRRALLRRAGRELDEMDEECVRCRACEIKNMLSLAPEVGLPAKIRTALQELVPVIDTFNSRASEFYNEISMQLDSLVRAFPTAEVNQGGIPLSISAVFGKDFRLDELRERLLNSSCNLTLEQRESRSTPVLARFNLSELTDEQKRKLCDGIESIRDWGRSLSSYEKAMYASVQLQRARKKAISVVNAAVGAE